MTSNNDDLEKEETVLNGRIEEEEKNKTYLWIVFLIASVFLFLIVIGLSYSIFNNRLSGNKVPIGSGVIFNYSDSDGNKSTISLKNARDLSDEVGKRQSGEGNYFDFNVSGNTKGVLKRYMILLEKDEMLSTISDSDIKVYLTKFYSGLEEEVNIDVPTFDELEEIIIDGKTYKVLHVNDFNVNQETKFSDDYIFRMWIKKDANDYYGKSYSIKVHIYTEGVGDLCE